MALIEHLPSHIETALRRRDIPLEQVKVAIPSDLDPQGQFGKQWLVIAGQHLFVFGDLGQDPEPSKVIPLDHIKGARAEALVGNGFLELDRSGHPEILLHFTNAVADRFRKLAQLLDRLAQDTSFEMAVDDGKEEYKCLSCGRNLPEAGQVCPKCLKKGQILRRLIGLATPYWPYCAAAFSLLLLGVALDLAPPYLWRTLVDEVLMPPNRHRDWLGWLVFGLVGQQLVRIGITILTNRTITKVGTQFTYELRTRMFAHLQELSVRYYDRTQVGTLMTRISTDTEELSSFISQALQGFLLNILLIVGIGIVLFTLNWQLSLFVLLPGPFVMVATYKFWRFIVPRINRYWYNRWRINALLNACFSGIRVVKAFAQEHREVLRFQERNKALYQSCRTLDASWHTFFPLISFVFGLGGLVIWLVGGRKVLNKEISLGTLMAFLGYLGMFYGPLSSLTQISQWLTRFMTAAHHVFEILDQKAEIAEGETNMEIEGVKGAVTFEGVTFGYDRFSTVLHDISFHVHPGELIGIVGRSGSGKTTLINLISRFYDPREGRILIDGVDIRQIKKYDLRAQIGLVLQEPYLFRGTIAENIAYGRPTATREEIIRAAKAANAHDFIVAFPEGYDTRIGERGAGLSGGEKQRVSIARAILNDPPILILDEATSSVDTETEKLIQDALSKLVKNRTALVIAHRLSTLRNADRVMVLENGRLAEFGTPAELIASKGIYYNLIRMQSELATVDGETTVNTEVA